MIYRFRVILDNEKKEEDVFRDLEIRETDTLEDFHNIITQSFGFDGTEMASFYKSDEQWSQGEEISLFDMSDGENNVKLMSETILEDIINEVNTKLIYVYDFLSLWTFLVELAEIVEENPNSDYPNLLFVHGQVPDEIPEKSFKAEESEDFDEYQNDLDTDNYDSLDFDENWN